MSTDRSGALRVRTALVRGALYLALWFVLLPSAKPADAALGLAAAAAAAWLSLRLLPPESGRLRLGALLRLLPHFLWESVRAGIDVARRALAPRVTLNPGFVHCATRFPPGLARNTFTTVASLVPGTVPSGDAGDALIVHCLDIEQPVAEQLGAEERRYAPALPAGEHHG
jgi:multicomponent Na+:H+ antiporter subunit E